MRLYFAILFMLLSNHLFAQGSSARNIVGLGVQVSYPFAGFSVMVNPNENMSVQGIVGKLGGLSSYSGRVLYRFSDGYSSSTYAYGLLGTFSFQGSSENKTETNMGYGIGIGIEISRENIGVPLWANFEIGYGNIDFESDDFNSSAIMVGIGIHYYLKMEQ